MEESNDQTKAFWDILDSETDKLGSHLTFLNV